VSTENEREKISVEAETTGKEFNRKIFQSTAHNWTIYSRALLGFLQ
jgi:hypothetical protein